MDTWLSLHSFLKKRRATMSQGQLKKSYIAGPSNAQGMILFKKFMDMIICKFRYMDIINKHKSYESMSKTNEWIECMFLYVRSTLGLSNKQVEAKSDGQALWAWTKVQNDSMSSTMLIVFIEYFLEKKIWFLYI